LSLEGTNFIWAVHDLFISGKKLMNALISVSL